MDSIVNGVYNGGIKDSYTLKETNLMEYSNAGLGNFETEYEGNTNYRTTIDRYVTTPLTIESTAETIKFTSSFVMLAGSLPNI